MDSKRKRKMVVPDGDYTGNTPGTGLPFERLRDPASGWDTEATAAPMLEQQYTLLGTAGAAGELHTGSGMAAASVPPASSSKLAGIVCYGEIDRQGKRKLSSDDDHADHKHSIGRRREHSNEPSSSMAAASAWQVGQKNNNDTLLVMRPSVAAHHEGESGSSLAMVSTSMAVEEEYRGKSDWPITGQTSGFFRALVEQEEPVMQLQVAPDQELYAPRKEQQADLQPERHRIQPGRAIRIQVQKARMDDHSRAHQCGLQRVVSLAQSRNIQPRMVNIEECASSTPCVPDSVKGSGVKMSTGIGALLQTLRENGDLPANQYEQVQLKTTVQQRTDVGTPKGHTNIINIPIGILEVILEQLGASDLRSAINSSFLFARVAMAPCHCGAFRPGGIFMGAIVKRSNSHLIVPQKRMQKNLFQSGIVLVQRFLNIATAARGYERAADAREGQILMLKDKKGKSLSILRPFHTRQVISLPPSPSVALDENLLSATLVPVPNDRMNVVLMFGGLGQQLKVSKFNSRTGLWDCKHLVSPFQISPINSLRNVAVYANNKIHILDLAMTKILVFDPLDNQLDSIVLPIEERKMTRQNNILARTRDGVLCWATIERMMVKVSVYISDSWKRRWNWCVPNKYYCCQILGQAQESGLLILGYSGELCTLDMETGEFAYLHDSKSSTGYLGFDFHHSMIDHL